jgi:phosphatidate cytidylyltransferase
VSEPVKRILTALIGAPVVLGLVYVGGWPLALLVAAAGAVGQYETYRLFRREGFKPLAFVGYPIGVLLVCIPLWPTAGIWALLGLLLMLGTVPFLRSDRPLHSFAATLAGIVYPPVLLSSVLYLRTGAGRALGVEDAFYLTSFVLVLIWGADVGAYYVGKTLGRRPLAPQISPNKTWEGVAGGTGAAMLMALGAGLTGAVVLSWVHLLGLVLICAVTSPIGDLLESRFKRSVEVKDAGSILPGHGGMMDRIDGLVYTVPLLVLYLRYVASLW